MVKPRTGLAAVAEDLGAGQEIARAGDVEQLDMLGLELPPSRKPTGRPVGQRNLRNQRVADYLLARYRDPLEGLVQMAGLGVADLAAALGCTRLEAFAEKRQCAIAALPYLHQRQAIAVDLTTRQAVYLSIVDDSGEAPSDAVQAAYEAAGMVLETAEVGDDG